MGIQCTHSLVQPVVIPETPIVVGAVVAVRETNHQHLHQKSNESRTHTHECDNQQKTEWRNEPKMALSNQRRRKPKVAHKSDVGEEEMKIRKKKNTRIYSLPTTAIERIGSADAHHRKLFLKIVSCGAVALRSALNELTTTMAVILLNARTTIENDREMCRCRLLTISATISTFTTRLWRFFWSA